MAPAACRRAFLLVLLAGVWSLPAPAQESYSVPQQPSLGDYARSLREKNRTKIKVTPEEAQHIFKAVDDITEFASIDSGMPKKTNVKRRLVGQTEVENLARENTLSDEERQERQRGLLAMKKFGLIPRDFDMESFVVQLLGESIAGFYDPRTKMISLLNWISLQEQLNVLAHELTHALQDQNY